LNICSLAVTIKGTCFVEVEVPLPAQLADRVSEALGALYRHPEQTLLAWYRIAIYDALLADGSRAGYAARAWIDVLSVRHVLFCWQPYARTRWPTAWLQPHDLLRLAEHTLEGVADPSVVQRQLTRAQALSDVVGERTTSVQYPAWCVFEAALRALESTWIYCTSGAVRAMQNSALPGSVGLDDASRYAAIAIAGSLTPARSAPKTQTAASDRTVATADAAAQLRLTFFWEWWLREAVPEAWCRG
jgi:hypothetical protein